MATIKAYTDLGQSKKLAEILPIESADMYIDTTVTPSFIGIIREDVPRPITINDLISNNGIYPCWSLAALLSLLKPCNSETYTIRGTLDGGATIEFSGITNVMYQEDNPLDAVFEMIVWLKENNEL